MTDSLRRTLAQALAEGLDREHPDVVLFTLHIGCGAFALGISGRVEPTEAAAKIATRLTSVK